jgi:type II secretory pathway component PulC
VDLSEYGFEEYDIVTRIGSTDITQGRPDFLALLAQAQSQGGVDLVVLRNGQEQKIRVGAR